MNLKRDLLICLLLLAVALAVRLFAASLIVFPPLDDPAAYIQTARHLAAGRGFVSDVLWNYWLNFNTVTHPSNEFWMPIPSLLMAGSMRVFGDNLLAAQWPGIVFGSLVPMLTYGLGRWLWPDQRRWSVLAALLVLPNAVAVYQSVSADSSALYTVFCVLTLFAGALAIDRRRVGYSAVCGLLCGVSYLVRSHGSILPIVIGVVALIKLRHELRRALPIALVFAVGYFILVLPWWLRNLNAFGTLQPIPLMTIAAAPDYNTWFNYTRQPTLSALLSNGWQTAIGVRLDALIKGLGVIVLITFPIGLLGLPVAAARRETIFRAFLMYALALYFGISLLIPTALPSGSFYHSIGSFAVFAALGFVIVIRRWAAKLNRRVWAVALYAIGLGLIVGQLFIALPIAAADSRSNYNVFTAINDWLVHNVPPNEPIITTQANSLNYASGYPALTLPNQQSIDVVRTLADRYGVRYVVITENVGLYPEAFDQADVKIAAQLPGAVIYDLRP